METQEKPLALRALVYWLPLGATIVLLTGLVYVAVQQNYRMSANDPQIQIAEDIATAVSAGNVTSDAIVSPTPTAEMSPSLATFVVIFSATGTPIGSSVALDGKLPTIPTGLLDYTKQHGQDRFTWQPKAGVRIAAVMVSFSGPNPGFVLAGRSLREVEIREKNLTIMTAVATLVALCASYLLMMFALSWGTKPAMAKVQDSHMDHDHNHDHPHGDAQV